MAETADMAPTRSTARRANGAASSRRRSSARTRPDDLEAQVQQLQTDIRSITHTLGRMGEMSVDQVKSTARTKAHDLAQRGQAVVEDAQDEFTQLEKQIKDTIRDKPLTAVAGAIALGFVLAVITR
jgi:ElaB/YqjD/DUF883 family membrane-anchored ribosome-binding protein